MSIDSTFKEIFNNLQPMIALRNNTSLKQLIGTNNKKQPKIYHTYAYSHRRSMYLMLHQSITLLPTSSQNNSIYKHSNKRDLYNFSPSHLP